MISVIIPVFNRAKLISLTLDSLCEQTEDDFEVIIVDDCSDDSILLKEILESYSNILNIRYFRHKNNLHGSAARNTGIKNAKGEYIAFLDSDDLWKKNKLEVCLKCFRYIDNKRTILYSNVIDRGGVYPKRGLFENEDISEYLIVSGGSMQTSSLFMYTEFAKEILFDASLKRFQDYDFIIRAGKYNKAKFKYINLTLVEMTDLDVGGRISHSTNPIHGLVWIEKNILSEKAKSVFVFNRLVNYNITNGDKISALKLIKKYKCWNYFFDLNIKVLIKLVMPKFILGIISK